MDRIITIQLEDQYLPNDQNLGGIFSNEEEGSLFLWAWPELLQWQSDYVWLFSPVVGRKWPGDIWGLDNQGNLLLVETKRGDSPKDPMRDFIGYAKELSIEVLNTIRHSELIHERWNKLLNQENIFIKRTLKSGSELDWWNDYHPGVIPYSSKRFIIRKWPQIYLELIVSQLLDPLYKDKVEAWLYLRKNQTDPKLHYIGLFTVPSGEEPGLSSRGRENFHLLKEVVGKEYVHWRALKVEVRESAPVKVIGWRPSFE